MQAVHIVHCFLYYLVSQYSQQKKYKSFRP